MVGVAVLAAYFYIAPALPDVETLREVKLQVPLRIYTRDGRLMAEFGEQRRIPLRLDEIPARLQRAFLAAEDDRFFEHPGVDYQGLVRAAISMLRTGERRQGGGTITMQLARLLECGLRGREGHDEEDVDLGLGTVGGQGVGIVAQAADVDVRVGYQCTDLVRGGLGQAGHVDVGSPGVAAFRFAYGPAHDLDAVKPFLRGKLNDLAE